MMAQSRAESTRDTYNYGQYLNQLPPNTIKVIREFERIQKKICRHKMSIMFNEICINEEMLPKYTYIYIYIYICRSVIRSIGIRRYSYEMWPIDVYFSTWSPLWYSHFSHRCSLIPFVKIFKEHIWRHQHFSQWSFPFTRVFLFVLVEIQQLMRFIYSFWWINLKVIFYEVYTLYDTEHSKEMVLLKN